ncbi:GIY-YIG nuclease family protein [Caniella muris]|uniref:GIY-YIG nuclease family protein n=1 Tax=Caniella muris TaxID=2941502 RepID=UPI00204009C8|nr:GIY-YIG nuclease family protein [Caniella muris]
MGEGYSVYMVRCSDGSLYTGYTVDVARRVASHNAGTGARYTRGRRPVSLAAEAGFPTRHEAMRAEALIKRLGRAEKLALVRLYGADPDRFRAAVADLIA